MATAVFNRDFHMNFPKEGFGFGAVANSTPQSFPREFIDAAVKAGAAARTPKKKPAVDK